MLIQAHFKIEYLDFAGVMAFQNDSLIVTIIRSSPNLKHFDISGNDIGDEVVEALAHTCQELEYLDLGGDRHCINQLRLAGAISNIKGSHPPEIAKYGYASLLCWILGIYWLARQVPFTHSLVFQEMLLFKQLQFRDDDLETEIRNQLPPQFKNVPFIIRAFHPGPVKYRVVQPQTLISDYFNGDPPTSVIHILVES
ncbi:7525_t:CDS:2 [Ambispora leptoticha]|uniref:7525_t:CDS:1 n=1 Tax=Ambispora leptoticha TaxID=144679 RepID=A0A9N9BTU6_9GLOM|nr:7525_t:CDS:2 [Ambispora leptoticha]